MAPHAVTEADRIATTNLPARNIMSPGYVSATPWQYIELAFAIPVPSSSRPHNRPR